MGKLDGKKVAILVTDGFEQVELTKPKQALEDAGATTHIVSPKDNEVKGWDETNWGDTFSVDISLDQASADNYDALLLPGGQINPDMLRADKKAVSFIKSFGDQHKPIAAICHGPWTLIEAGLASGRKMTSFNSIQTDLKNAGAHWVDQEVVVDQGIITSRNPDDIPVFNETIIEEFAKVDEAAHA